MPIELRNRFARFESYVYDCTQTVRIDTTTSNSIRVSIAVTQGSPSVGDVALRVDHIKGFGILFAA